MSQEEKLQKKFFQNSESLRLADIEKVLVSLGFVKIPAKGSHVKWKHSSLQNDLIIPVHHKDCKNFYKKLAQKTCLSLSQ